MSQPKDLISLHKAEEFLELTLQLRFPLDRLRENRAGFLRDVILSYEGKIPFQSVTLIATPAQERRGLTFEEIKLDMMSRKGGLCCELNSFMKVLLQTLGFEVYHVAFRVFGKPTNHMSNVVRNLNKPGDLHLVDVGSGYPVFEPISLDFEKESPLYKAGFLHHKFVKGADGTLRWMHRVYRDYYDGPPASIVDEWYTFMVSDMKPREIEFFTDSMETIHTVESGPEALTPFLVTLKRDYRNGRLFAIKDTTILEEDASGEVTKKRLTSPQELLEAYKVHFPQFPTKTVEQAIQTVKYNLKFEK